MSKQHKFGIIGCGVVAQHHAESIRASGRGEIVAVCDIVEERAVEFGKEYGVEAENCYTDYRKLVDDPNVEIVCICTLSGVHGEQATYAAKAGKHILCEKPIAIQKEDLDAIQEAVQENGVKMSSVFQMRTKKLYKVVKDAVASGKFGKITLADAYIKSYRSPEYYASAGWRGTWELDGGGALMNQGIHGIDMLLWIAGDVESVFARTATLARDIEVEDTAVAVVKFKNGGMGVIEGTTSVYPGQNKRFEIHGTKGSVIFGEEGIDLWKVEGAEDEPIPTIEVETEDTSSNPQNFDKTSHLPLVNDLLDAIEQDRSPMIPVEEGRKAVDLILAIYESSRTGKEVFLD